jgi:formylmethanofuran dehydrogenase subunit B
MAVNSQKRARKQDQAIAALLEQPTISKAAKKAGVGERTLLRWLQLDDFQAALRIAQRKVLSQAIAQLQQAASESVRTFLSVMLDECASASARVAAAKIVLDFAIKGVEREDLEKRLTALEQKFEEIQHAGERRSR